MRVIMLKDVKGVGQRDTVQEVSDGYALNYLIARGLAQQATPQKIADLAARQQKQTVANAEREQEWAAAIKRLSGVRISVTARANASGHLYEQLSPDLVTDALRHQLRVDIPASCLVINAPIKQIGETDAVVKLGNQSAKITISVVGAAK